MKQAFLIINGKSFPAPKRGLHIKTITTIHEAKNEHNAFIGQRIGRDQQNIEGVEWPYLSASDWSVILKQLSDFVFDVTYLDPVTNDWITRKMYVTDRECEPYRIDPATGKTVMYKACKCNFVDTGR